MSDIYNSIMTGLTEAIQDVETTEAKLNRKIVTIPPVKQHEASNQCILNITDNIGDAQT